MESGNVSEKSGNFLEGQGKYRVIHVVRNTVTFSYTLVWATRRASLLPSACKKS